MGNTSRPDNTARHEVLRECVDVLTRARVEFVGIGSIAGAIHAGVDWEHENEDIDVLVPRSDARRAQAILAHFGYASVDPSENWLLKAIKRDVTVDLIFELTGGIVLDDEIMEYAVPAELCGARLLVMSPEEYAMSQAISASAETPQHWFNAVNTLRQARINPGRFERRSAWNADRAEALLLFARSLGIELRASVVR
jgi:hypothetical protein